MWTPAFARVATARSLKAICIPAWAVLCFALRQPIRWRIIARNNEFYHALSDTHYAMTVRDGAYYQRRWQIGFGGKHVNVEELKIDYVLGSGNHARSYLHRTARGTLIELPLGWYSEKGGYWAMSPGFDSRHPATRRLISYECVFCHDGYPQIPPGHEASGSEPAFTGDLSEGIDCQRCHGPGASHVETVQRAGASPEKIRATIVNPARLSPKLRMDLCMQCHLEPTTTALSCFGPAFQSRTVFIHPRRAAGRFRIGFRSSTRNSTTMTSSKSSAVPRTGFVNRDVSAKARRR